MTAHTPATSRIPDWLRRAVLFSSPVAAAVIVAGHPADPSTATDLGSSLDLYIAIHVALLFVLPFLGMTIWLLLDGLTSMAATASRLLLPFVLVFYAAFDALVGIGAGLVAREALAFRAPENLGAQALAARWMEIPPPIPILGLLGPLSWTLALLSAAGAHRRAGSPVVVVVALALAGPLFGFGHALISGPIAMASLLAAAVVLERERRTLSRGELRSTPAVSS